VAEPIRGRASIDQVGKLQLQRRPKSVQYAHALFKAYSHMLCIGYGEVNPVSTVEILLTTVSMLLGAGLFAGIVGALTAYLSSLDSPSARYELLQSETNDFMEKQGLPAPLRGRVRAHLDATHGRGRRALGFAVVDQQRILHDLSPQLRREVRAHLVRRVVEGSPLLNGTLVRRAVAVKAAEFLEPLAVAAEGEVVLDRDEPPNELPRDRAEGNRFGSEAVGAPRRAPRRAARSLSPTGTSSTRAPWASSTRGTWWRRSRRARTSASCPSCLIPWRCSPSPRSRGARRRFG